MKNILYYSFLFILFIFIYPLPPAFAGLVGYRMSDTFKSQKEDDQKCEQFATQEEKTKANVKKYGEEAAKDMKGRDPASVVEYLKEEDSDLKEEKEDDDVVQ